MAMAETSDPPHVRHSRRKPFSTWMKRLTNLKSSSSSGTQSGSREASGKGNVHNNILKSGNKRQNGCAKNNPYPLSGTIRDIGSPRSYNDTVSYTESTETDQHRLDQSASQHSLQASASEQNIPGNSAKSTAPTLSTMGDTARSETGYSKAGTTMTGPGGVYGGGEGSTFSSPAPSVRSLTTTLTTVQSAAPSAHIYGIAQNNQNINGPISSAQNGLQQQTQFAHQFPPSPASAVPPHVAMTGHPTTYSSATANNILTDNASILTLASSSKRRRRNSLDTNASMRALAPSSVFGGSRESLPLSVLSANVGADASNASITNASGVLSRQSLGGLASAERISVYSASGTVPPLVHGGGDRSSLIAAGKQGDNGSIRSGTHSHTRNDSAAGSVSGTIGSTLNNNTSAAAAITPGAMPGRISRRSSGWGEISGEGEEGGAHQRCEIDESSEKTEEANQENSLANGDPESSIDEKAKQ
ncbi:conserved hypothetical protein [Talaromyces stipitatus ATCC 10500]|uniref:Ca2+-modulated nonselective cation channel polycystin n=1 Tax=Talaromyces stipitatus (strain ATCC 10500 / CBS 375.48 / QM 6759 / NRRL 1006) TaxID=441959 RepID=B8LUC2_TALSN|nr:uncharacterized protein TSTA_070980 [Talaromyces stipitatus ATCC 10500]EED23695.1 conserved hypothetical protein [Talaromyces stipitatus ATCC 10500]